MAVFVGQGALANVASGNATPAFGTGAAAPKPGDLIVVPAASADAVAHSWPAGWKVFQWALAAKLQASLGLRIYDGQFTAPLITHAAGSTLGARCLAFRGPFPPDVLDRIVAGTPQLDTGITTATAPAITPQEGWALLLAFFAEELTGNTSGGPSWASYSGTNPTLAEVTDSVANAGPDDIAFAVAWGQAATSPATGNRTAVVSGEAAAPTNIMGVLLSIPDTPLRALRVTESLAPPGYLDVAASWPPPQVTGAASTPVSDSDSGTASLEDAQLVAAIPVTDTGSGSDSSTETAVYSVADTGTGSDSGLVTVPVTGTDSNGATTETATLAAALPLTETGTGAETTSLAVGIPVTDASGVGSDAGGLNAIYGVTDAGSPASDTSSLTAAIPVTDTGSGADTASVQTPATPITGSDSNGATTETASVQIQTPPPPVVVGGQRKRWRPRPIHISGQGSPWPSWESIELGIVWQDVHDHGTSTENAVVTDRTAEQRKAEDELLLGLLT